MRNAIKNLVSKLRLVSATSFLEAARIGLINVVKQYLRENLNNPTALNIVDSNRRTALILAAMGGHIDIVTALLDAPNIDINLSALNGDTALIAAVFANNIEIIRVLLHHGADISHQNQQNLTATQIALQIPACHEIADLLVNHELLLQEDFLEEFEEDFPEGEQPEMKLDFGPNPLQDRLDALEKEGYKFRVPNDFLDMVFINQIMPQPVELSCGKSLNETTISNMLESKLEKCPNCQQKFHDPSHQIQGKLFLPNHNLRGAIGEFVDIQEENAKKSKKQKVEQGALQGKIVELEKELKETRKQLELASQHQRRRDAQLRFFFPQATGSSAVGSALRSDQELLSSSSSSSADRGMKRKHSGI